jgi:poly(hydroxyalkanoate) granule-associated protein
MSAKKRKKQDQSENAAGEVSERLEQVFLAGLGALSTASDIGAKTFDSLVDQGQAYRKAASKKTEKLLGDVQGAVREVSEGAQTRASGLIDQVREQSKVTRLHDVFDQRVEGALHRIGVPTQSDIKALNAKLDKLMKLAESKNKKPAVRKAAKKKAAPKKKTARKATSTKRKVAKKAPAK